MKVSVIVFPGSNGDHDIEHICGGVLGSETTLVWHRDTDLKNPDVVVIPGGFAYGDYLRPGALSKISPIMSEIKRFAEKGGPVLGICNGFQTLCETGLLPGVLLLNAERRFLSRFVHYRVEAADTPFTRVYAPGQIITSPIAHNEGNYFADDETLRMLEDEGRVVFRYCGPEGELDPGNREWNPNGAVNAIAGICSAKRNVVGLMPHPERASEEIVGHIGGGIGRGVFESVLGTEQSRG